MNKENIGNLNESIPLEAGYALVSNALDAVLDADHIEPMLRAMSIPRVMAMRRFLLEHEMMGKSRN